MKNTITPEQKTALFNAACKARKMAYLLPVTTYSVGAAVLTKEGTIFTGCNIENDAHTPTICAERLALFKAYSEGERAIIAMMCVTEECGVSCGVCRQVISQLAPEATLFYASISQNKEIITSIDELLPYRWSNPALSS
jgi:cytidine deaminase